LFARVFHGHIDTVKRGYHWRLLSGGDEIRTVFLQCVVRSCQIGRPCYRGLFEAAVAASCRIQGPDLIADKNRMTRAKYEILRYLKVNNNSYQIINRPLERAVKWKNRLKRSRSRTSTEVRARYNELLQLRAWRRRFGLSRPWPETRQDLQVMA
jgi:hypothetical protein